MMGLMQLLKYPSQKVILKTVSEGLYAGKMDPVGTGETNGKTGLF